MLKFFREIRQKLLAEGKLKSYALHAVGEIFLVVVGILIALQINNWNEDREDDAIFERYVERLKIDVRTAIKNLNEVRTNREMLVMASYPIFEFLEKSDRLPAELNLFEQVLVALGKYDVPQVHVGLLGQLLDGNIEMISRDESLMLQALELENKTETNLGIIKHIQDWAYDSIATNYSFRTTGSNSGEKVHLVSNFNGQNDFDRLNLPQEIKYAALQAHGHTINSVSLFSTKLIEDLGAFLVILEDREQ